MTPAPATRPVLIALSLLLAGCGDGEGQGRLEALADQVAGLDVPIRPDRPARTAAETGLRPADFRAVQVAVMDPHDMWDARDAQAASLRPAPLPTKTRGPEAPAVVETAATPAPRIEADPSSPVVRTIQLGAYGDEKAARAAWARLSRADALSGLTPAFETVEVGGRVLTRLKVATGEGRSAAAICQAAGVDDPWCRRAG